MTLTQNELAALYEFVNQFAPQTNGLQKIGLQSIFDKLTPAPEESPGAAVIEDVIEDTTIGGAWG